MKYRISISVIQFKPKLEQAWGLKEWEGIDDPDKDLLFFGLYNDRDWDIFQNYQGNRNVFWCGSDILRALQDYERQRVLKISPAKHYCETEKEAELLRKINIEPEIIPSFLGNISEYPISFRPPKDEERWKIWMCGHEHREQEYGFDQAKELAALYPDIEIHFFGVEKKYQGKPYSSSDDLPNVFYHGQVPEKELDEMIKKFHCGFRPNINDGFSEVVVKSVLLGQPCITKIPYKFTWSYESWEVLVQLINKLRQNQIGPDYENRTKLIKELNQFPWCKQKFWNPEEDSSSGNGYGRRKSDKSS